MLLILTAVALALDPIVEVDLKYQLYDFDSAKIETRREPCLIPIRANGGKPSAKKPATTTQRLHFIRLNAKNRLGGYTGWQNKTLVERDGKIVRLYSSFYLDSEAEDYCPLSKSQSQTTGSTNGS